MAQNATIYKVELSVCDMDRHYYAEHALTLALHPSETEERMMVRLLAFIRNAHERLIFGKGISTDEEPDLWHLDYSGEIRLWIEVGLPDERRIRKACGRADAVQVYLYGTLADKWWRDNEQAMNALDKVSVFQLPDTSALKTLCQRNMSLQCTIQDGDVWLSDTRGALGAHLLVCQALKLP